VKKPLIITAVVLVIGVIAFLNIRFKKKSEIAVDLARVSRQTVEKIVSASGTIKPKRRVNVSASSIGKVTRIAVKEGDYVSKGAFLLQIDPTEYRTAVDKLRSGIRAAVANLAVESASLKKAVYDYERARDLHAQGFLSDGELKDASVALEIQQSRAEAAKETLFQQKAALAKAEHDLREVRITAEMGGTVTALNVEEGENAIMGTLNNPGTVLLTIADLSEMEARVEVDETEIIHIQKGQEAEVQLDAYPDTSFSGIVSEVGNSAIPSPSRAARESVDFEVVISIRDSIPGIRPGLSASAEIKVARVDSALVIPIQCLTVRKRSELKRSAADSVEADGHKAAETTKKDEEIEGAFVVTSGTARFRRITVGIAGEKHFEVKSGVATGEEVVSGPFKILTELKDGAHVKSKKKTQPASAKK